MAESPRTRGLRAQVEITRAEMRGRSLKPLPSLSYSREDAAGSKEDYLLFEQSLPVSGRLGLLREAGQVAVNARQEESKHDLVQLRTELRLAFYDLLQAQQRMAVIRKGVSDLQEVIRILTNREQEGEGSKFDRLRAERELADVSAELTSAEAMVIRARARVASFLAPGADLALLVADDQFNIQKALPPLPDLVARALEVRGDYRAEVNQLQQLQLERRAADRLRIPEPIIGGGMKKVQTSLISDTGFVLSVTVPLPSFNRGRAEAALAQAAFERTQANHSALEQQIAAEVKGAYDVTLLRRRLAQEYQRGVGEKVVELTGIARAAYEEGEQRILEVLDAYRVTLASQLRALELVAEAKQAEIELDRAVGKEVSLE